MFNTFIWDFDGTLFNTYPMIVQGYMLALKDYGIESSKEEIYRLLKEYSSAAIAKKFQVDFTELSDNAKLHEEKSTYLPKSFSGTKKVLRAVARKQKRNIILTHRRQDSTQLLLEREQLDDLISEIVGPENEFPRKPDPTALQYLLDKYSLDPKKTVMIGDRALDVDAGKNAGVHTLFFDNENLLHNIQADHRVTTMQEIERFV
ncbi:HAD-IA family hydrolase [Tetragenococcus muriaticus]|uniref:HAD-IA family hydrolase n=1 Tax=Tetragenococcus muriaticus TaxID=64642 RepID=UPI0003F6EB52|nr:HAD-IA family hydrolase [Tetragenococcus muriaticus]GMA47096.1 phosphoglycolate phosphatase [Tetragenococcus muriaticus]